MNRSLAPTQIAAVLASLSCPLFVQGLLGSGEDSYTEGEKLFSLEVKPLLEQKCFSCHGEEKWKGDLILTNREDMLLGGETSDEVLIPRDGSNSLMYIATTWENHDYEMPPKEADRLSEEQTWAIRDWIDAGAPWPSAGDQALIVEKYAEGVVVPTSGGLDDAWTFRRYEPENLWAYRPIDDPQVPSTWESVNPIDAFIDSKLDEVGLEPAGLADRRTLIRRATFDLLGLPPTLEETEAFLGDIGSDEEAFARVVERLLADSRYGEQWGRHWLDVVRYADSSGFSNDYERPHAWRYRDYVIRAFNQDKPFDEFIIEQVAGDEWNPDDPEALVATGFLRMGPWEHTAMAVARVSRQQFLDDVTDSVGQVFLSHPLQCARCHDHKFDPIPTRDYYRIQAVFGTTHFADREVPFLSCENLAGFAEKEVMEKRVQYFATMRDALKDKAAQALEEWCLEQGIPVGTRKELEEIGISEEKLPPRNHGLTFEELGVRKVGEKNAKRTAFEMTKFEPYAFSVYSGPPAEKEQSSGSLWTLPEEACEEAQVEPSHILTGGDPFARGEEVTPGVFSALPDSNDKLGRTAYNDIPDSPTGRRLAFAKWLANPKNTLVARSMANRIWLYHFGRGIVDTPNNFGAMGGKPSHPELLDFLATRFVESGWSIKSMHRLIMSSGAYRRSTEHGSRERLVEKDPVGKLYAAFGPRRLSAEEIRDSMLFVSGELSSETGGLPARPEINMDVALQPRQVMGSFAASYEPARRPDDRNRRSVYAKKVRGLRNPFLEVFNQPSPDESCAFRQTSTVTPQVFSLFNSEDVLNRAVATAIELLDENRSREAIIRDLFARAYGRAPGPTDLQLCLDHWAKMEARHETLQFESRSYPKQVVRSAVEEMTGAAFNFTEVLFGFEEYQPDPGLADVDAETRALADICLVVFNSNEFLYVY